MTLWSVVVSQLNTVEPCSVRARLPSSTMIACSVSVIRSPPGQGDIPSSLGDGCDARLPTAGSAKRTGVRAERLAETHGQALVERGRGAADEPRQAEPGGDVDLLAVLVHRAADHPGHPLRRQRARRRTGVGGAAPREEPGGHHPGDDVDDPHPRPGEFVAQRLREGAEGGLGGRVDRLLAYAEPT